jgi:hypothetical protein
MTALQEEPKTQISLSIPVTIENNLFVENLCTSGGYTFKTLFEHLLNLYKKSLVDPLSQEERPARAPKEAIEAKLPNPKKR